jgi:hypothetical protein
MGVAAGVRIASPSPLPSHEPTSQGSELRDSLGCPWPFTLTPSGVSCRCARNVPGARSSWKPAAAVNTSDGGAFGHVSNWRCGRAKPPSAAGKVNDAKAGKVNGPRGGRERKSGAAARAMAPTPWRGCQRAGRRAIDRGGSPRFLRGNYDRANYGAGNSLNGPASMPYCFILRCRVL